MLYNDVIQRFLSLYLNRFRRFAGHREDIEQELRLACWRAEAKYDPTRAKPITFFWWVCWNASHKWRERQSQLIRAPRKRVPIVPAPLVTDDHDLPVCDAIADDWTPAMLAALPSRERYIVEQIALMERSQTELAAELRISKQRAHQLYTRALEKLRAKMIRDRIMA